MRTGVFWEAMIVYTKDRNMEHHSICEVIRGVGVRLFNIQLKPKDQIKDVRKFMPFPWDESDEDPEVERLAHLSKEQRDEEARVFMEKIKF